MTSNYDDSEQTSRESATAKLDRETVFETVEPDTLQTVVKLLLGIGALLFLLGIVSVLPGLDRVIPATPVTATALAVALVTVAIVAVLAYAAPHVETLVEQAVAENESLAPEGGNIAKYLVVLVAVLVAYRGFAGVIVPFLAPSNTVWMYDVAFLVFGLVPTALIALALYRALDPAAEQLTDTLTAVTTEQVDDESSTATEKSDTSADDSDVETATSEESADVTDTESVENVDAEEADTTDDTEASTDEDSEPSR